MSYYGQPGTADKEMDPMVLYQMRSREALGDDAK